MFSNIPVPKVVIHRKSVEPSAQRKKKKAVLNVKAHPHQWENRAELSDTYELSTSEREGWWRTDLRVTPGPGSYEVTDFIQEIEKRPNTYSFKGKVRNSYKDPNRSGVFLLPGGYEYQDFLHVLSKKPATYRFKAEERYVRDVLNFGLKDKYVNIPPNAYHCEKHLAIDGETQPAKNYMFRSQSKRLVTQTFRLKDGPAPGTYSVKDVNAVVPAITSSFRSKIPRFETAPTILQGPGSYFNTVQKATPADIVGLRKQCGLFFNNEHLTW